MAQVPPSAPDSYNGGMFAPLLAGILLHAPFRTEMNVDVPHAVTVLSSDLLGEMKLDLPKFDLAPTVNIRGLDGGFATAYRPLVTGNVLKAEELEDFTQALCGPTSIGLAGIDINNVEVLKGPQGTLFGRNNISGVINLGPGTMFVPNDPSYQVMVSIGNFEMPFGDPPFAGPGFTVQLGKLRSVCAQIGKKEPDGKVSFRAVSPKDPILVKIAEAAAATRSKGPWTQALMWMYTDKATLKQVNDRLLPAIQPGHYVRNLYTISANGGFSEKDMANAKMFEASLVFAPTGSKETSAWIAKTLSSRHGSALASALSKKSAASEALFTGANTEIQKEHAQAMVTTLLGEPSPGILIGVLTFMRDVVPDAAKGWFAGSSDQVKGLAGHADKSVAKLAGAVVTRYGF